MRRFAVLALAYGVVRLMAGCGDTPPGPPTAPGATGTMVPSSGPTIDLVDAPPSASVDFLVSGFDPMPKQDSALGFFPTTTIVSIDVHQAIRLTSTDPGGGSTVMGLGGRVVGDGGCFGDGEAYLAQTLVDGGFGFAFRGCDLPDRAATSYSGLIAVQGTLVYGWSGDRSCPPPGERCSSYSGSSGIRVTRLPASLEFTVEPDPASLGAVPAGQAFTFRGRATPDHLGSFDTPLTTVGGGWFFTDTAGQTSEVGCEWIVTPGQKVCTWEFYESGSISLRAIVNGVHVTGGPIAVTAIQPRLELSLSKETAMVGDTVVVTTTVTPAGGREEDQRFRFVIDPPNDGGVIFPTRRNTNPAVVATAAGVSTPPRTQDAMPSALPECNSETPFPKRCYVVMYGEGVGDVLVSLRYNRLSLTARKTINVIGGPSIRITKAHGPNGDEHSFTTLAGEDTVVLAAEVSPASAAGSVKWTVTPNRAGTYTPRAPVPAGDGANSRFVVPHIVPDTSRADTLRWPRQHRDALDLTRKVMAYTVIASVTVGGTTISSAPVVVTQDADDVLRQEYVDWRKKHILTRAEIRTAGNAALNYGDYTRWPSNALIDERLPILQGVAEREFGRAIVITGGYRNPVHHHYHLPGRRHAPESRHLYAGAVDFNVLNPPTIAASENPPAPPIPARRLSPREYFDLIKRIAKHPNVDACFEPADEIIAGSPTHTLDHAHVDWGRACKGGW